MADATDAAKSRAQELGVNIEEVQGSGSEGRVTVPDVEAFAKAQEQGGTQQAQSQEEYQQSPVRMVQAILNPSTGLGGYTFEDGFDALPRKRYPLSEDDFKQYAKAKHRGKQVLIKS